MTRRRAIRRSTAIAAGKAVRLASRALGKGGGTALPGLVATAIYPSIVRDLTHSLEAGAIVVAGTNGKTTTCRLAGSIAQGAGLAPLRNTSGSNLERGLASALVDQMSVLDGENSALLGIFEVDEAALPNVLKSISPRVLVLLDLFRDQLDRYGEVASVAAAWKLALGSLSPSVTVWVNADDPLLVEAVAETPANVRYFGMDDAPETLGGPDHGGDVKRCPRCGAAIKYEGVFFGHLGNYHCDQCGLTRPEPVVSARQVVLKGLDGASFVLRAFGEARAINLKLPGLYNVYNAVAAAAATATVGVDLAAIATGLEATHPAFGRMEHITVNDQELILALVKNPTGANAVLRTIDGAALDLLVLLNDNAADGHDVSWIWDADFELLSGRLKSVVFSGTRAADMALRFKYAGIDVSEDAIQVDVDEALGQALRNAGPTGKVLVIPTYTALLQVRGSLAKSGYVRPYWEA
ncbi:MAG: MurT ligase domain-containing protein [Chloroflexota bacterium]